MLDTNICSAIIDQNRLAMVEFYRKYSQCYLVMVVIAELYKGAYCSRQLEENLEDINDFISMIPTIVDLDQDAAEEFDKIQGELKLMGRPTGDLDALIAAVARSRGDILVTNNTRHFINILNLQLDNWLR